MFKKGDPQITKAWTFYDWANSVYSLVIATAIFPIFYNAVTTEKDSEGIVINDTVSFFGFDVVNTALYSYVIAASIGLVILILPIISGIADYTGKKKTFLQVFCYLGAGATATLFFFDTAYLEISMLSIFLASFGFWGSVAIYNSYLPDIAEAKDHDKLSAKGFSKGYIGSVILLVVNLVMVQVLNISAKWCFIMVAVWWAGFAQYTFKYLPKIPKVESEHGNTNSILVHGFKEISAVTKKVFKTLRLKRYLIAFFVFSMAVQTIMLMAQFFGMKEVYRIDEFGNEVQGLETSQLIIAILAIQIIAAPGAYFFSWLSSKIENKKTLIVAVSIWILICLGAFFFVRTPTTFFIAAGFIGFVMGGTQSLARSTYSKFLPESKDTTSYFSLFDVAEKIGIVIGLFTFGYIEEITGSMRNSVLALILFFGLGLILLFFVPKTEKKLNPDEFQS